VNWRNPALYYFAAVILVTIAATILVSRRRIARQQKSFFLTALAITVSTNVILCIAFLIVGRIYAEGWHAFTLEAWTSNNGHNLKDAMDDIMVLTVVGSLICILPALGAAYYYDRQSKKNEKIVA
jgi:hypothetical protein